MKKTILLTIILTSIFLYGCSNATPPQQQNTNPPTTDNTQQVTPPVTTDIQTPPVTTPPVTITTPKPTTPATPPVVKKPAESAKQAVTIQNFSFNPGALNVTIGTTVVWTNMDPMPHQIKSDSFNSSALSQGQSFEHKFETAGTYDYSCKIHPSMTGQIIVQ